MTERMRASIAAYAAEIGAELTAMKETPEELIPYGVYVPDSGYCVLVIPESLADRPVEEPLWNAVPVPTRYVAKKGYRIQDELVYCDVPYDNEMGARIPELYCVYRRESAAGAGNATVLRRGNPFLPVIGHPEGMYFTFNQSGAYAIANYTEPTNEEIAAFTAGNKVKIGLFREEGLLFILLKFGEMQWVDAPYNPAFEKLPPIPSFPDGSGIPLTCLMTSALYGTIVAGPRLVVLPTKLSREFCKAVQELVAAPVTGALYDLKLAGIQRMYSTEDMVRDAIIIEEL